MPERLFVAIEGENVADALAGPVITVNLVIPDAHQGAKQTNPRPVLLPQRAKRGIRLKLFHIEYAILDVKRRAHIVHLELRLRPCNLRL